MSGTSFLYGLHTPVGSFALWPAFSTSDLPDKTPRRHPAVAGLPGCPVLDDSPRAHAVSGLFTRSCPSPVGIIVSLPPGAFGASRVLRRLSSCMPRPEDSGGFPHPRQSGCFLLPSSTLKLSASATSLSRSCTSTSGCATIPTAYRILCVRLPRLCSRITPLRDGINTRYGRVASPYPTGTSTPQETPSFARRDNAQAQPTAGPLRLTSAPRRALLLR